MTNLIEVMCLSIHKTISRFTDDAWYLSKLLVALGICLNIIVVAHKIGFSGVETQEQWVRLLIFIIPIALIYLAVSKFANQESSKRTKEKYNGRDYVVLAWLVSSMFIFPLL